MLLCVGVWGPTIPVLKAGHPSVLFIMWVCFCIAGVVWLGLSFLPSSATPLALYMWCARYMYMYMYFHVYTCVVGMSSVYMCVGYEYRVHVHVHVHVRLV